MGRHERNENKIMIKKFKEPHCLIFFFFFFGGGAGKATEKLRDLRYELVVPLGDIEPEQAQS